jgi:hypothetical protein
MPSRRSRDDSVARPVLLSRLHEHILDTFNEHGVQIMTPNFEGQPERPVVVPPSRGFAEPATRVEQRVAGRPERGAPS